MKKKNNYLSWVSPGVFLVGLGLGTLFSIELIKYGFFILIATTLISLFYFNNTLMHFSKNEKIGKSGFYLGFLAIFFVSLFFGMQSRVPFGVWALGIGIVFIVVGLIKLKE